MYFQDLASCEYAGPVHAQRWQAPLRAVGWLEHPHPYRRGTVPTRVRARLLELRDQTLAAFAHHGFCGEHECSLCRAEGLSTPPLHLSALNLFIPGEGCIYAAPGAVDHYFAIHAYCPPEEFCVAVLQCPDCDSPRYWDALRRSNGGNVPLAHVIKLDGNCRLVWDGDT